MMSVVVRREVVTKELLTKWCCQLNTCWTACTDYSIHIPVALQRMCQNEAKATRKYLHFKGRHPVSDHTCPCLLLDYPIRGNNILSRIHAPLLLVTVVLVHMFSDHLMMLHSVVDQAMDVVSRISDHLMLGRLLDRAAVHRAAVHRAAVHRAASA